MSLAEALDRMSERTVPNVWSPAAEVRVQFKVKLELEFKVEFSWIWVVLALADD